MLFYVCTSVELFHQAKKLLTAEQSYSEKKRGADLLEQAMRADNTKAKRRLAYHNLLGFPDIIEVNFTRAFELFTELADAGNPAGQHALGFMYSLGLGVNASQAKAVVYYTFGALGGDVLAQMTMGYRYLSGISVDQSCETALVYYSKVAEAVASELTFISTSPIPKPRVFEEETDSQQERFDDDLRHYYELLADKGELQAQMLLAQFYMTGMHGVERDFQRALHHLEQAAGDGHAVAYANIGKIYLEGDHNVEVDYKKALEYFTKAANLKEGTGLAGLGIMYLKGLEVEKDEAKAFTYFSQSANRGSLEGHVYLGEQLLKGVGASQNYKSAQQHLQVAAQHGHMLARYYLGYMFTHGKSLPRSCPSAVDSMKMVADNGEWSKMFVDALKAYESDNFEGALLRYLLLGELGYEKAQSNAAHILETYTLKFVSGDEENSRRALMMWKRAAAQGYPLARLKVGDYYYYGLGTEVDYEAAVNQYQIASDQLLPQALFNLGYMHQHGLGLKRDYHLAKRCYDNAAEVSEEADVPVALALLKLNYYDFFLENLGMETIWSGAIMEYVHFLPSLLGKNWDMYAVTALAFLLGLIYLIRQNR
jgi:TPR repeat protein